MRLMDWLTLSSGTNASRDTHGDGAAFQSVRIRTKRTEQLAATL